MIINISEMLYPNTLKIKILLLYLHLNPTYEFIISICAICQISPFFLITYSIVSRENWNLKKVKKQQQMVKQIFYISYMSFSYQKISKEPFFCQKYLVSASIKGSKWYFKTKWGFRKYLLIMVWKIYFSLSWLHNYTVC